MWQWQWQWRWKRHQGTRSQAGPSVMQSYFLGSQAVANEADGRGGGRGLDKVRRVAGRAAVAAWVGVSAVERASE